MKTNAMEISIDKVISERRSIRSFNNKEINPALLKRIKEYTSVVDNPFSNQIRVVFSNEKISQVITGKVSYLVALCKDDVKSLLAIGYFFEKVILFTTSLHLGSVWLGGSINRADFIEKIGLNENEKVVAVSPIGYEAETPKFRDRLLKLISKRKPFSSNFFFSDFNTRLTESLAGDYYSCFENVRLAPSALNRQPWRILLAGKSVHFYAVNETCYVEIGIALAHFHLTAIEHELKGEFVFQDPNIKTKYHYIVSWNFA